MADPLKSTFTIKDGKVQGLNANLDGLESKIFIEKGFFDVGFKVEYLYNSAVNLIYGLAKLNFRLFSTLYNVAASTNSLVDELITTIITKSADVFDSFYTTFLPLMIVATAVYSLYMVGKRRKNFFMTFFKGAALIIVAGALYKPLGNTGESGVAHIYNAVNELTANMASEAIKGLATGAVGAAKNEIAQAEMEAEGIVVSPTDEAIKVYFDHSLWNAYVGMNSDVNLETGKSNLTDTQLRELIAIEIGKNDASLGDERLEEVIGKDDEIEVKNLRRITFVKFEYAILAWVDTLLTGLLLAGIGLMSLALRLIIMVVFFVLPIIVAIGVVPMFTYLLESTLINVGKNLFFSQFINVALVAVLAIDKSVMGIFTQLIPSYIAAFFAKWLTYFIAWKTRRFWINMIKPKNHTRLGQAFNKVQSFGDKVLQPTKERVLEGALLANGYRRMWKTQRRDNKFKKQRMKNYLGQGDNFTLARMQSERDLAMVKLERQSYAEAREDKVKARRNKMQELKQQGTISIAGKPLLTSDKKFNRLVSGNPVPVAEREKQANLQSVADLSRRIQAQKKVSSMPDYDRVKNLVEARKNGEVSINRQSKFRPATPVLSQINGRLTKGQEVTYASIDSISSLKKQGASIVRKQAESRLGGFDSYPYFEQKVSPLNFKGVEDAMVKPLDVTSEKPKTTATMIPRNGSNPSVKVRQVLAPEKSLVMASKPIEVRPETIKAAEALVPKPSASSMVEMKPKASSVPVTVGLEKTKPLTVSGSTVKVAPVSVPERSTIEAIKPIKNQPEVIKVAETLSPKQSVNSAAKTQPIASSSPVKVSFEQSKSVLLQPRQETIVKTEVKPQLSSTVGSGQSFSKMKMASSMPSSSLAIEKHTKGNIKYETYSKNNSSRNFTMPSTLGRYRKG